MRYLTHENEDNFWTSHGAKPHPLAKAEAEKRTQIRLEEEAFKSADTTKSKQQKVVNFSDDQLYSGRQFSNGNARLADTADMHPGDIDIDLPTVSKDEMTSEQVDGGAISPTKRNYIGMSDDEIIQAQAHAQRVGYKVSTV